MSQDVSVDWVPRGRVSRNIERKEINPLADAKIITQTRLAFSDASRPEHFTNFRHCEECQEHDDLLRSRDLETLTIEDVGNVGWNPISFITPEGFSYYFPALARLSLAEPIYGLDCCLPHLLFHLTHNGAENDHLRFCSRQQRLAVVDFLKYVTESRHRHVAAEECGDELERAIALWSN